MTTPILTAAAARRPRHNPRAIPQEPGGGEGKKSPHNFVAQGPKRKAGAPLGNRNAARRSRADVDRQARVEALVRQSLALAHAADAALDQACLEREALRMFLAEPRNV
jgi:hypothetical protein